MISLPNPGLYVIRRCHTSDVTMTTVEACLFHFRFCHVDNILSLPPSGYVGMKRHKFQVCFPLPYIRFTHCHLRCRSLVSAMLGVWLTYLSPFHLRISRKNSCFYFWLRFMDRKVAYLPSVVLYSDEKARLFDRLELQFHQYNISLLKEIENKLFNSM